MPTVLGSDGAILKFSITQDKLRVEYHCPSGGEGERTVFLALQTKAEAGSAVVPFSETFEGSTVFLPFQANQIYLLSMGTDSSSVSKRTWENWKWSDRHETGNELDLEVGVCDCRVGLPLSALGQNLKVVLYSKDFTQDKTWGRFFGASDPSVGKGDSAATPAREPQNAALGDPARVAAPPPSASAAPSGLPPGMTADAFTAAMQPNTGGNVVYYKIE
jgi:hypothetical protein